VAIAWAAWFPNAETRPPSEVFGWRAIVLPLGAQLFAVGTRVLAYFVTLPPSERLLTIAILAIGAAQIVISRPRPPKRSTIPIGSDPAAPRSTRPVMPGAGSQFSRGKQPIKGDDYGEQGKSDSRRK
jgi:hypothetical protein